jgi:hypothetical protein
MHEIFFLVWIGDGVATEFTKVVFKRKQFFAQLPPEGTKPKYMIFSARNPVSKLDQ